VTKEHARRIAIRAQMLDASRPSDLLELVRLVGKVDATANRKASLLRVAAIHEDVKFTGAMTKAVRAELDELASWLGLGVV
jgi:uncharacterized protein YcaQ